MNDNDIIKALECCGNGTRCAECPVENSAEAWCMDDLMLGALNLINRQKAENEELDKQKHKLCGDILCEKAEINRLKCQVNRLKQYDEERDIRLHARLTENARAEAIKEFAEEFERRCIQGGIYPAFIKRTLDRLVKEYEGK